jgi:hypothetical protein
MKSRAALSSPASTLTGCKIVPYLLTAPRQFDILPALADGDGMEFDQLKRREPATPLAIAFEAML